MDTTASKFGTAVRMLRYVDFETARPAIGRRLHATGKPYSACTTNAERDGWIAALSASIDAGRACAQPAVIDARREAPELVTA